MTTTNSDAETSDADAGDTARSIMWKCTDSFSGNNRRWQEGASETAAVISCGGQLQAARRGRRYVVRCD